jgi:uncharacterized protein YciI
MQFMITAYDGTDADALKRRLQVREDHLAGAKQLQASGQLIAGGAILDDRGEMIGSTLYMEFESKEQLQEWLDSDPYVVNGVWLDIKVEPIKLAFR